MPSTSFITCYNINLICDSHLELFKMVANQNRKFDALVGERQLQNVEDPSMVTLSYQMLSTANNQLIADNRVFDVPGIFCGISLIVGGGYSTHIENPSSVTLGYILLTLATNQWVDDNNKN